MGFCLYLEVSASPYTVCVICFMYFRVMSGWLSSVWKCIRCLSISVYIYVCRSVSPSVSLSSVSASHCLSSVCMSLSSFVCVLVIAAYIIHYHPECMQSASKCTRSHKSYFTLHQDLCTRNHRSTNKIK